MGEFLVLLACWNNAGCQETSSQYYSQNPEFREFVKTEENQINKFLGPLVTQYGGPILLAASGREATARLTTRFYLTFSLDKQILLFKEEF